MAKNEGIADRGPFGRVWKKNCIIVSRAVFGPRGLLVSQPAYCAPMGPLLQPSDSLSMFQGLVGKCTQCCFDPFCYNMFRASPPAPVSLIWAGTNAKGVDGGDLYVCFLGSFWQMALLAFVCVKVQRFQSIGVTGYRIALCFASVNGHLLILVFIAFKSTQWLARLGRLFMDNA